VWNEKFLQYTAEGTLTDSDQRVLEYQSGAIAIASWNIQVRDTAYRDAT